MPKAWASSPPSPVLCQEFNDHSNLPAALRKLASGGTGARSTSGSATRRSNELQSNCKWHLPGTTHDYSTICQLFPRLSAITQHPPKTSHPRSKLPLRRTIPKIPAIHLKFFFLQPISRQKFKIDCVVRCAQSLANKSTLKNFSLSVTLKIVHCASGKCGYTLSAKGGKLGSLH